MSFLGQEEQIRELQERFRYVYLGIIIGILILFSRLVYLQVVRGDLMRQYSEENRIKKVKIASPRGMIFDRNGTLLLDNRPAFDLEITPQYLRESRRSEETIRLLASLIKMKESEIQAILNKFRGQPSFLPVKIKSDLSREEVALIETWKIDMPGVAIQQEIKRTNLYGEVAAHLLGYIGEVSSTELPQLNKGGERYKLGDSIGKFGIEQKLEDILRGVDGEKWVEVDALGRIKLEKKKGSGVINSQELEKSATPGKNVVLTIDQDLQMAAREAFGKEKIGAMVAIDPNTGEILSMLSLPAFDPTEFARGIPAQLWNRLLTNENRPLRDKTIQDHYPPGSVFKTVTAIAGLEEGVVNENFSVVCTGSVNVGNRKYHCWKKGGHGVVDTVNAIVKSCDTYFYRLAQKMKVDQIAEWALHLGLGKRTGIPLAREVPGLIPTEAWKKKRFGTEWQAGETLSVAIGQGAVLTTVLQLANVYATIANGGTQYRPYIVKRIESIDGQLLQDSKPEPLDRTRLKARTYEIIKKGLWEVVNNPNGTMYANRLPGMDFGGKTGTAQVISLKADKIYSKCENMRFRDRHHGLFAGFAPVDNPKIAVAVIAEHSCHGASGAGPIAAAVVKRYLEKIDPARYSPEAIQARLKTENQGKPVTRFLKKATTSAEDEEDVNRDESDSNLRRSKTENEER